MRSSIDLRRAVDRWKLLEVIDLRCAMDESVVEALCQLKHLRRLCLQEVVTPEQMHRICRACPLRRVMVQEIDLVALAPALPLLRRITTTRIPANGFDAGFLFPCLTRLDLLDFSADVTKWTVPAGEAWEATCNDNTWAVVRRKKKMWL